MWVFAAGAQIPIPLFELQVQPSDLKEQPSEPLLFLFQVFLALQQFYPGSLFP